MWIGIAYGLTACALWGFTYLLPLMLDQYGPLYITLARAIVMGAFSLAALAAQHRLLSSLTARDWRFALVLSFIGNALQCWMLMLSVEYASPVLAGVCFGMIPVLVALIANERDRRKGRLYVPLARLAVPLAVMFTGLLVANWSELVTSLSAGNSPLRFLMGVGFGLASTAMWTWYPIRNADWLLDHPDFSPTLWTSVQFVLLLPLGLILWVAVWLIRGDMPSIVGPDPVKFGLLMLFAGTVCSWGASSLWNAMSQRVPTSLVGQMLVFETVFSVFFGHLWDMRLPTPQLLVGLAMMIGSVVWSLRLFEKAKGEGRGTVSPRRQGA